MSKAFIRQPIPIERNLINSFNSHTGVASVAALIGLYVLKTKKWIYDNSSANWSLKLLANVNTESFDVIIRNSGVTLPTITINLGSYLTLAALASDIDSQLGVNGSCNIRVADGKLEISNVGTSDGDFIQVNNFSDVWLDEFLGFYDGQKNYSLVEYSELSAQPGNLSDNLQLRFAGEAEYYPIFNRVVRNLQDDVRTVQKQLIWLKDGEEENSATSEAIVLNGKKVFQDNLSFDNTINYPTINFPIKDDNAWHEIINYAATYDADFNSSYTGGVICSKIKFDSASQSGILALANCEMNVDGVFPTWTPQITYNINRKLWGYEYSYSAIINSITNFIYAPDHTDELRVSIGYETGDNFIELIKSKSTRINSLGVHRRTYNWLDSENADFYRVFTPQDSWSEIRDAYTKWYGEINLNTASDVKYPWLLKDHTTGDSLAVVYSMPSANTYAFSYVIDAEKLDNATHLDITQNDGTAINNIATTGVISWPSSGMCQFKPGTYYPEWEITVNNIASFPSIQVGHTLINYNSTAAITYGIGKIKAINGNVITVIDFVGRFGGYEPDVAGGTVYTMGSVSTVETPAEVDSVTALLAPLGTVSTSSAYKNFNRYLNPIHFVGEGKVLWACQGLLADLFLPANLSATWAGIPLLESIKYNINSIFKNIEFNSILGSTYGSNMPNCVVNYCPAILFELDSNRTTVNAGLEFVDCTTCGSLAGVLNNNWTTNSYLYTLENFKFKNIKFATPCFNTASIAEEDDRYIDSNNIYVDDQLALLWTQNNFELYPSAINATHWGCLPVIKYDNVEFDNIKFTNSNLTKNYKYLGLLNSISTADFVASNCDLQGIIRTYSYNNIKLDNVAASKIELGISRYAFSTLAGMTGNVDFVYHDDTDGKLCDLAVEKYIAGSNFAVMKGARIDFTKLAFSYSARDNFNIYSSTMIALNSYNYACLGICDINNITCPQIIVRGNPLTKISNVKSYLHYIASIYGGYLVGQGISNLRCEDIQKLSIDNVLATLESDVSVASNTACNINVLNCSDVILNGIKVVNDSTLTTDYAALVGINFRNSNAKVSNSILQNPSGLDYYYPINAVQSNLVIDDCSNSTDATGAISCFVSMLPNRGLRPDILFDDSDKGVVFIPDATIVNNNIYVPTTVGGFESTVSLNNIRHYPTAADYDYVVLHSKDTKVNTNNSDLIVRMKNIDYTIGNAYGCGLISSDSVAQNYCLKEFVVDGVNVKPSSSSTTNFNIGQIKFDVTVADLDRNIQNINCQNINVLSTGSLCPVAISATTPHLISNNGLVLYEKKNIAKIGNILLKDIVLKVGENTSATIIAKNADGIYKTLDAGFLSYSGFYLYSPSFNSLLAHFPSPYDNEYVESISLDNVQIKYDHASQTLANTDNFVISTTFFDLETPDTSLAGGVSPKALESYPLKNVKIFNCDVIANTIYAVSAYINKHIISLVKNSVDGPMNYWYNYDMLITDCHIDNNSNVQTLGTTNGGGFNHVIHPFSDSQQLITGIGVGDVPCREYQAFLDTESGSFNLISEISLTDTNVYSILGIIQIVTSDNNIITIDACKNKVPPLQYNASAGYSQIVDYIELFFRSYGIKCNAYIYNSSYPAPTLYLRVDFEEPKVKAINFFAPTLGIISVVSSKVLNFIDGENVFDSVTGATGTIISHGYVPSLACPLSDLIGLGYHYANIQVTNGFAFTSDITGSVSSFVLATPDVYDLLSGGGSHIPIVLADITSNNCYGFYTPSSSSFLGDLSQNTNIFATKTLGTDFYSRYMEKNIIQKVMFKIASVPAGHSNPTLITLNANYPSWAQAANTAAIITRSDGDKNAPITKVFFDSAIDHLAFTPPNKITVDGDFSAAGGDYANGYVTFIRRYPITRRGIKIKNNY